MVCSKCNATLTSRETPYGKCTTCIVRSYKFALGREPLIAVVDRTAPPLYSSCTGCFMCQSVCPYNAIEREEIKDRNGNLVKQLAFINPGLCQGCGTCVAVCKSKSIDIEGYTNLQMYSEVDALLNF